MALSPEQIAHFIAEGFLVLPPVPEEADVYARHFAAAERLGDTAEELGNNILPAMPELAPEVYETPRVKGALTSLLGPGYAMHAHRFCHKSVPGRQQQTWHRDSFWGNLYPRNHRPYWVMALYFPQDTSFAMGPTEVLPRSQYWNAGGGSNPKDDVRGFKNTFGAGRYSDKAIAKGTMGNKWHLAQMSPQCAAGTVVLIHYDIWHRGPANTAAPPGVRYMFKFQFMRMTSPADYPLDLGPDAAWHPHLTEADPHDAIIRSRKLAKCYVPQGRRPFTRAHLLPVWQSQWAWLRGDGGGGGGGEAVVPLPDGNAPPPAPAAPPAAAPAPPPAAPAALPAAAAAAAKASPEVTAPTAGADADAKTVARLFASLAQIEDDREPSRVSAAYKLGALVRQGALDPAALVTAAGVRGRTAAQAFEAAGTSVLPALLDRADELTSDGAAHVVFSVGRVLDTMSTSEQASSALVASAVEVLGKLCNGVSVRGKKQSEVVTTIAVFALGNVRTAASAEILLGLTKLPHQGPNVRAAVLHSLLRLLTTGVLDNTETLRKLAATVSAETSPKGRYVTAYAAELMHRLEGAGAAEGAAADGKVRDFAPLVKKCIYGNGWAAK
mmetsp:Transcript_15151/g.38955  ORF Transcript_15151/g.38955 Transcript_15151/m.38955 type:complete len:609 (-) Transcript_15151:252-2078(-)